MSASFGTRVTKDEKSVTVFATDSREVETLPALSVRSTASARPTEYGSWKSRITTFLTLSLSIMKCASLGPWM